MSAIAGIVRLDETPVERRDLERMLAAMRHRGPHARGIWTEGSVGLAHCALHSTPESLYETQPLVHGDWVLVADARLDHREALLDALDSAAVSRCEDGAAPRPITDVDLILATHEKWRDDCVHRLLGDFTFAIWNKRSRRLFIARDHFGVRPFYYVQLDGLYAFASDVGALLALEQVPVRINEVRIADFLVDELEGVDEECTFYEGVFRMPPAHRGALGRGALRMERYWTMTTPTELRLGSDEAYAEAFLEVFSKAVKSRLRGVGPAGAMLSGGLDSSSIVAIARDVIGESSNDHLHTFSCVTRELDCVETQCAMAVIEQGRVESHLIYPDQLAEHVAAMNLVLEGNLDPFDVMLSGAPLPAYSSACKAGCRYVLDGMPGDLLLTLGDEYLTQLFRLGQWRAAAEEAVGAKKFFVDATHKPSKVLAEAAIRAFLPAPIRAVARRVRAGRRAHHANATIDQSIISQDFARAALVQARLLNWRERCAPPRHESIAETHARTFRQGWLTAAIERYGRVAAQLSIEARHPFLDKGLVEFCVALPWNQKMSHGRTKIVLRRAMDKCLPTEVTWRRRRGHPGSSFNRSWVRLLAGRTLGQLARRPFGMERYVKKGVDYAIAEEGSSGTEALFHIQLIALDSWLNRASAHNSPNLRPSYSMTSQTEETV